jgi:hypothetical protein
MIVLTVKVFLFLQGRFIQESRKWWWWWWWWRWWSWRWWNVSKKISVTVLHSYLDFGASRSIVIVHTWAFVDGVFDVTIGAVAKSIYTIPYYATSRCYTIPYHTIPYHTIPYHTIPYHTIPYHTIPNHTIYHTLNRTKPHYTIPYLTISYNIYLL